ncbi:MAG TPA: alpha/beta hydrolase [Polyangia bacterium]|nr:alpha/beta hydrolase [Polyangia bacterium]
MLSRSAEDWRARGRVIDVGGRGVFTISAGDGGVPMLLLHGFPSSSYDFHRCWDAWAARRRVVALDFVGFGFSAKPADFSYSLHEQADAVEVVAARLGITRAHVVAHDMGTSVATELCARHARKLCGFDFASLTLMNGSVHIEHSRLTPSQKLLRLPALGPLFARLARGWTFRAQLRRILGRPDALSAEELEDMWQLIREGGGHLRLPQTIGYVAERWRFHRRWIGALEVFDRPALVLWGARDPVAVLHIAELVARETPGARLVTLDDLGHYPMLEDPARVTHELDQFLATVDAAQKSR